MFRGNIASASNFEKQTKKINSIRQVKRDGIKGGWRKLHNEELHDLYSSPSISTFTNLRRMKWARHVARMGERRNVYRGKETTRNTKM
jgi:hypothetical protein